MKEASIFLLLLLPFVLLAQKADQCLCTEEDFYDDNFLNLESNTNYNQIAIPAAQQVAYLEVDAFSYQRLEADEPAIETANEPETWDEVMEELEYEEQQFMENEVINEVITVPAPYQVPMMVQEKPQRIQKSTNPTTTASGNTRLEPRKKVTRVRLKSRKKARKYKGKCPSF